MKLGGFDPQTTDLYGGFLYKSWGYPQSSPEIDGFSMKHPYLGFSNDESEAPIFESALVIIPSGMDC